MGSVAYNEWCYAIIEPIVLVVFGEKFILEEGSCGRIPANLDHFVNETNECIHIIQNNFIGVSLMKVKVKEP